MSKEWISVKERLPELPKGKTCIQVMVVFETGDELYSIDKDMFSDMNSVLQDGSKPSWGMKSKEPKVLFWMPMPELPQELKSEEVANV